jgi:sigma-B regulation protein RsbU (phosphoserine phosphatase)
MRKRRILLAEDVELFLMLEKHFLHRDEFELITVHSGEEALAMIREMEPALIFLDLLMPGISGDECCLAIKKDERYRQIPVVIVAKGGRDDDLNRCLEAGCDAVILKPINCQDFLETTRKCLRTENRSASRYSARFLINYGTDPQKLLTCYSVNLSAGGLFLETDHPLETGTTFRLEFLFPDSDKRTSCSARVTWANHPELLQKPDLPPGMGVQFLDLTLADMEILRFYIKKGCLPLIYTSFANDPSVSGREKDVLKVLVADDNAGSINRLRAILDHGSYIVLGAVTCEEALALTIAEHPDLVIVNTAMQGKAGYKLCVTLARNRETADIPVLVLSGWSLSIGSVSGLERGAIDHISRPFNESDILARVKNCMNIHRLSGSLFRTHRKLQEKEHDNEESLSSAAIIQQSLLPTASPEGTSFDFAWRFMPCERVGGDLFNVFRLDENHIGVYVLDVSGHGVPAAMVTTSVAQALDPFSGQILKRITPSPPYYELASPAEVLARLNRDYPIERFGKHLTICYLLLDIQSGKVRYSNAALPLPFLIRADGRIESLCEGGTIIGMGENASYDEGEVIMGHGDRLFLYTDGIVEYLNTRGEFYGEELLVRELKGAGGKTLQAACACVIQSLMSFGGKQQPQDDITLLGIEFRQPTRDE